MTNVIAKTIEMNFNCVQLHDKSTQTITVRWKYHMWTCRLFWWHLQVIKNAVYRPISYSVIIKKIQLSNYSSLFTLSWAYYTHDQDLICAWKHLNLDQLPTSLDLPHRTTLQKMPWTLHLWHLCHILSKHWLCMRIHKMFVRWKKTVYPKYIYSS